MFVLPDLVESDLTDELERGRKADVTRAFSLFYNLYEARIRNYQKDPPPPDWNGAYQLLTK